MQDEKGKVTPTAQNPEPQLLNLLPPRIRVCNTREKGKVSAVHLRVAAQGVFTLRPFAQICSIAQQAHVQDTGTFGAR